MEEMAWQGLGVSTEITEDRQKNARINADVEEDFHRLSKTHMWVVFLSHKASDQLLDALDGSPDAHPMLDADTLLGPPATGCLICEQRYDPILRKRACPGDPR
jgi:hypothetical protein